MCLVLSCVVLCCLVSLFDLTGSVKSSGRRRVFWSSRLLVLSLFLHNLFVRFSSLGLRLKAHSPAQVLPLKGFAVLRVSLCRNPLGDRQVLKGVTQPNVTILSRRGSIGDDR